MLVIRLSRVGKKNQAIYRIVVAEKEKSAKGKFLEELGTYYPRIDKDNVKINQEKIKYWLEKGAQPSLTMLGILKKQSLLPENLTKQYDRYIDHMKKHKKSAKKNAPAEEDKTKAVAGESKQEEKPVEAKKEIKAEQAKPAAEKVEKKKEVSAKKPEDAK